MGHLTPAGVNPDDESPKVARLAELARMMVEVAGAADLETAAEIVTSRAATVLGASAVAISVLGGSRTLRLMKRKGDDRLDLTAWERFPIDDANPVSEAVRTRRPVTAGSREEIATRWPGVVPENASHGSLITLPLMSGEHCVGALGLSFPHEQAFTDIDRQYLTALADSFAQAVERISAIQAAADATAKLSFLAEASEALAGSLDYEATLQTVADLAVPRLADWCAIDLLEDGTLRRVAVSHVDPSKVRLAWELNERFPSDMEAPSGPPAVVRTGRSELLEVDEALLDALNLDDERRKLVYDLQLRSALTVALQARGRTLGVIQFIFAESDRRYSAEDVPFAEDLARRAAVAIDNSQLHTETLQSALLLQRAILPASFADTESWRVGVHYRPAGRTEVGGDFFDALTLPDGRMVALVGDVMGRGISAAATMAQVRAAIRAYLTEDPDPAEVLRRLDKMFTDLDMAQLITLAYALIDPAGRQVKVGHAGHLPPLILHPDGTVDRLAVPPSPPLGLGGSRPILTAGFAGGDALVLYTDGLIERRGEDIDDGLDRLQSQASTLVGRVSDSALAEVADRLRQAGNDDDVTLLVVHPLSRAG